ncbi:hypothetical protein B0H10DRAFT_2117892 [Mycena sp. CBHHK59/15]|nr:hypothetical protein B0H10DRAFT_2117892 [Mycena sp. CBHHK59/15]
MALTVNAADEACIALEKKLHDFAADEKAIESDSREHLCFLGILAEVCDLVRAACAQDATNPATATVIDRASQTINEAIELGFEKLEFSFLPSFAHSDEYPMLPGPQKDKNIYSHRMSGLLKQIEEWIAEGTMKRPDDPNLMPRLPYHWNTTPRPHTLSTPLSRFNNGITGLTSTTPLMDAIFQARCEISSDSINLPIGLVNNGSCLVLPCMGGWKNRSPSLTYYRLDEDAAPKEKFPLISGHVDVGLTEIAYWATTDEQRKLMFVADTYRVKSYAWADAQTGETYDSAFPTHTLHTSDHRGPLHVLAPGRFLRAGKGSAGVWHLDELKTHGPDGSARVGRRFDISGSSRDEEDVLEDSSGSEPTTVINFADSNVAPAKWHPHPLVATTMLCGSDPAKSKDYSCISLDLEHGGKTVARYLGHGGETRAFSTSISEPNIFLTGSDDSYARLYDHRLPLPVLTLIAGSEQDHCAGLAFVHPDGIPTVFTGAAHEEVVRLWDIRARKMVYELSTGNNEVTGMTWDAERSALYVSTTCDYVDRNGEAYGYRRAKIPRSQDPFWAHYGGAIEHDEDESRSDDSESDEDDYADDDPCWPKDAAHAENYFGHVFDCGDHRIFRYTFKEHADPSILPEYGDAGLDMDPSW